MTENDIRSIALFFYFALLDDRAAIAAGAEALNLAREKAKAHPGFTGPIALVSATSLIWEKKRAAPMHAPADTSGWTLPPGYDLGPWQDFHRQASAEELVVVIWSQILGYSENQISLGLALPEGTVRYRLARALRKLGGLSAFRPRLI